MKRKNPVKMLLLLKRQVLISRHVIPNFFPDEVAKLLTAFHQFDLSPLRLRLGNDRLRKYPTRREGNRFIDVQPKWLLSQATFSCF